MVKRFDEMVDDERVKDKKRRFDEMVDDERL